MTSIPFPVIELNLVASGIGTRSFLAARTIASPRGRPEVTSHAARSRRDRLRTPLLTTHNPAFDGVPCGPTTAAASLRPTAAMRCVARPTSSSWTRSTEQDAGAAVLLPPAEAKSWRSCPFSSVVFRLPAVSKHTFAVCGASEPHSITFARGLAPWRRSISGRTNRLSPS